MRAMKVRPGAKVISIREAEAETGLPATLLRDLIRRGELKAITPPNIRRVFISRRELEAALVRWEVQL